MMTRIAFLFCLVAVSDASAQAPDDVGRLLRNPAVKAALDAARAGEPVTIQDQVRFCQIPAPTLTLLAVALSQPWERPVP